MRKSSALVLVGKSSDPAALRALAEVSKEREMHLSILVLGTTPAVPIYSYGVGIYGAVEIPVEWQEQVEQDKRTLSQTAQSFGDMAAAAGVDADIRALCAERRSLQEDISRRALSVDFVILANDLRNEPDLFEAALQAAVSHSSAGVLLNLKDPLGCLAPKRVFVAWNDGVQAGRAVRAALPMLREADEVTVAIFDPVMTEHGDGENAGSDVARWLTHHGCNVNVQQLPSGGLKTGEAIMLRAIEVGADLVVMGAYDHSRMREVVFGGTTQTMIEQTGIPVLFAH